MNEVPSIIAFVTFLSPEAGGRATGVRDEGYRPHLVPGNPEQREAVVDSTGTGTEEYLGVQFAGPGRQLSPGVEYPVPLILMYSPAVDYSSLQPGATFTIRERRSIIGFGRVVE